MHIHELRDLINSISYKPGFVMLLIGNAFPQPAILIGGGENSNAMDIRIQMTICENPYRIVMQMPVVDADDPNFQNSHILQGTIHLSESDVEKFTREAAIESIFNWIKDVELHEAGEFFRVAGVKVKDPHAPYIVEINLDGIKQESE